ncbi:unnamed protein product [Rhizoctonia solani]|uniref:Uncharacterized protein n=1 Tax=Rhizoctonia solani TaxID=456999 RepID=A0A8H3GBC6_9AGAM|nr:unnamed protein product [Rhizoctonia solani]
MIMEQEPNFEELWKDPKFREFVSQYGKPLATNSKPPSPPGAWGSKPETPCVNSNDDEDRGRLRTQETHIPSVRSFDNRSSSPLGDRLTELQGPLPTNEVSAYSRQDLVHNKGIDSRQSPSHRERSYSPYPKASRPHWEQEASKDYCRNQDKQYHSSRRSRSTSRDQNYEHAQYRRSRSRSRSPKHYNGYNRRYNSRSRSRSRSPRPSKYSSRYKSRSRSRSPRPNKRYPYRSERLSSPRHSYDHHEQHHYRRKRSQSPPRNQAPPPRRTETKPLDPSKSLPNPPDGWSDKGYYHSARMSYTKGGKDGDRDGEMRGGPSMVVDKSGTPRKYKTLLERMSKQEKYHFVKAHNHPFSDVAGIPYFNPYGKVPLDNKLTAIIPKAAESLFISSGQRLDFPEYLEGRAVTRAAISCNVPDNATIEPGKSLNWSHFGLSVRLNIYEYVYELKPYYYHFRDKTGENNWLIDSIAREYLKEVGGYLRKSGNTTVDAIEYLHRHAAKSMKNKEIQKSYIEEPDTENPYYFPKADRNYAGSTRVEGATKRTNPASSSTKARDARRADRIVAQEEARAKVNTHSVKPAPTKAVPKTGVKIKTETKVNHGIESDTDSDDEGLRIPQRSTSKRKVASSEAEELEEDEPPMKKSLTIDKEKESEKKVLSAKERARLKMRPRLEPEPREDEPEQTEPDEASNRIITKPRAKKRVLSPEAKASNVEDLPPTDHNLSVDGLRVVKATKMMIQAPATDSVAGRTRQRTKP